MVQMFFIITCINYLFNIEDGSLVPESCCQKDNPLNQHSLDMCTGKIKAYPNWPPVHLPPVIETPTNYTLYTTVRYKIKKNIYNKIVWNSNGHLLCSSDLFYFVIEYIYLI